MCRVRFPLVMALIALMPTLALAYTLGPGDKLDVEVRAAQAELSLQIGVTVDGRIYISPVGTLVAEGKTPAELEADIARELGRYYVGPLQVAVLVVEPKQVRVSVLGEVAQPGDYKLTDDRPLLSQVIAQAGGLRPQASWRRISLMRAGQELGPVDLYAILKLGRTEANHVLRPYDVITVPPREQWVTVVGSVQEPGVYELLPGDTLSKLVPMAGGVNADVDLDKAVIERHTADGRTLTLPVNLRAALSAGGSQADPALQANDIVRVPTRVTQVYVLGEVTEPGAKPYEDNRTIFDYIGSAGGMTARAKANRIALVRPGTPEPKVMPVDLNALMAGRPNASAPQLQPGDIIFVPERTIATVADWGSLGQVLTGIVAAARIF